nr:cytochrome oxidase putative small subunit CydP [Herbaspirillum sp. ASV7]
MSVLRKLPRLTRLPLGVEITILLVIKIALITVLAKTFFAHPEAKHMRMPTASVEQRMLAPAPTNTATPQVPTSPE